MFTRQGKSDKPHVGIVSPAILEHPFSMGEVARGSKRMQYDIPDFVQDQTRKFIVVGFFWATLAERLQLLPVFLYYCWVHEYDLLIYWETSDRCEGKYSDILCLPNLTKNMYKERNELVTLPISVHVWDQPHWDGWNDRQKQLNCAGTFFSDNLLHAEDFNLEGLHDTLMNSLGPEATQKMNEWCSATFVAQTLHTEEMLTSHFAIRDAVTFQAEFHVKAVCKNMVKKDKIAVGLVIEPTPLSKKQAYLLAEAIHPNYENVDMWRLWPEVATAVKQRCLQEFGPDNFELFILVERPEIFDELFKLFGNTVNYGPVHDAGFHERKQCVDKSPPVKDTALQIATGLACTHIHGWSGGPIFEYIARVGRNQEVHRLKLSHELLGVPAGYDVPRFERPKFVSMCSLGDWDPRAPTIKQIMLKNADDIGGRLLAFQNIPKDSHGILKQINTEPMLSMFHELILQLAAESTDDSIDKTKLGQALAADGKYRAFMDNKHQYNQKPCISTVGNPKWLTALFEGPYMYYRTKVLGLPKYYHHGEGVYKILYESSPATDTNTKRRKVGVVPKAPIQAGP